MSDLIERSEVLKQLWLNHKDIVYIDKNECAKRIEAIPSARPKGEWMPYEAYLGKDREYSVTEHKCSLCGYLWGEPEYRYCPNCGARMKGADDE